MVSILIFVDIEAVQQLLSVIIFSRLQFGPIDDLQTVSSRGIFFSEYSITLPFNHI